MDDLFDGAEVISSYTNEQAVEDGLKAYIFQNRWPQLTGGKPITITASLVGKFSDAAFIDMWNDFVALRRGQRVPGAKLDGNMMVTSMNRETVWLIEDGECFTFLRPSDY